MQHSPTTQLKLLEGVLIGFLRSSADFAHDEQNQVVTDSFGGSSLKVNPDDRLARNVQGEALAVVTITTAESDRPASVKVADSLAFEGFGPVLFTALFYREKAWDFGTDYDPAVLELDVYTVSDQVLSGIPAFIKIDVRDLEEPIFYTIPRDEGIELTCAYFDEQLQDWEPLNCPEEHSSPHTTTCCARSDAKVALISTEYLQVSRGTA
jgi:hypothetical protein